MTAVARTGLIAAMSCIVLGSGSAQTTNTPVEQPIANPVATFTGLDKITGRIIKFDVFINETVQFGALQVTPRACNSRPESVKQQTTAFLEVDEVTLDKKIKRIFTGWMFADSPGLSAVEHSVYDVWLFGCKQSADFGVDAAAEEGDEADSGVPLDGDAIAVPVPRPKPQSASFN